MSQSTIQIERVKSLDGCLANIKIFIDGDEVGQIPNGKSAKFRTSTGRHKIEAKLGWRKSSITVDLEDDSTSRIELSPGMSDLTLRPL